MHHSAHVEVGGDLAWKTPWTPGIAPRPSGLEVDPFGPLNYLASLQFESLRKLGMILAFDLKILFKVGHWSISVCF